MAGTNTKIEISKETIAFAQKLINNRISTCPGNFEAVFHLVYFDYAKKVSSEGRGNAELERCLLKFAEVGIEGDSTAMIYLKEVGETLKQWRKMYDEFHKKKDEEYEKLKKHFSMGQLLP